MGTQAQRLHSWFSSKEKNEGFASNAFSKASRRKSSGVWLGGYLRGEPEWVERVFYSLGTKFEVSFCASKETKWKI